MSESSPEAPKGPREVPAASSPQSVPFNTVPMPTAGADPQPKPDAQLESETDAEAEAARKARRAKRRKARAEKAAAEKAAAEAAAAKKAASKPAAKKRIEPPAVIEVAPIAKPAAMRQRHWGVILSFIVVVVAPVVVSAWYLWTQATPQYGSTVAFTVRQEETASAVDALTPLLGAGSSQKDTDILYQYIQSQDLVARVNDRINMIAHYSEPWPTDRAFAISPDSNIEDLTDFWQRVVQVAYDSNTGLMEVRVLAFDAEVAHDLATTILNESQRLINDLNAQAREDTLRYAELDLLEAQAQLRSAREALILFRTRTQIVDPETDVQGRMGVVNTLQQELAQALVELDLLAERTNESDPRLTQLERRIEVIRVRIAEERKNVASGDGSIDGKDYPTLIAEYEGLIVDREFAEEKYRLSQVALDSAVQNANRQSRYLAAYVQPTIPQTAEYPRKFVLIGLISLFSFLAWSIMALVYYSVRDSR